MNALWAGMMLMAIIYGTFHGTIPAVTQAALDSAKEAVSLCITMLGILSFWMGLMQIGAASGLVERLTKGVEPLLRRLFPRIPAGHPAMRMTRGIRPVLRWLFPRIPEDHPALEQIAVNCIANVLGLGWAATPAGLKAMEELAELEKKRRAYPAGVASDEMCTFLILNISSLQLIPVNIIAYRSQYGSVNPTLIVGPAIVATMVSTAVAVVFCRIMQKSYCKNK